MLTEEELQDALYHRETLVMLYLTDTKAGLDIENGADRCVTFDKLVCEALGIDVESHPPDYIFDALVSGCGI